MNIKSFFSIVWMILLSNLCFSQNLVPNGSFESYYECPSSLNMLYQCHDWVSSINSCDYYNGCKSDIQGVSIPQNFAGYQWPLDGQAYAGIITYDKPTDDYREILGVQLIEPMQLGLEYFISFKFCRGDGLIMQRASNNLGVKFSHTIAPSAEDAIDNSAHLNIDTLISDTSNWNLFYGSFVADSDYSHLLIGNFFNDLNTFSVSFDDVFDTDAYYLIDDVRLSLDSDFVHFSISNYHETDENLPRAYLTSGGIVITNTHRTIEYFIYDSYGRLLEVDSLNPFEFCTVENILSTKGLYFIVFNDDVGTIKTQRLIKYSQ